MHLFAKSLIQITFICLLFSVSTGLQAEIRCPCENLNLQEQSDLKFYESLNREEKDQNAYLLEDKDFVYNIENLWDSTKTMSPKTPPPFSYLAKSLHVGKLYQHYKGLRYHVIALARHSETLEELVVYQALYGEKGIWVRPLSMFLENVTIEGITQPRFKLLEDPLP